MTTTNQGAERIAVVGGGIAGMTAARMLADDGRDVVVLDKGRGPGGRMARRRHAEFEFDHGAQYFTARDPSFIAQVEAWQRDGIVREWTGRVVTIDQDGRTGPGPTSPRFVGTPGMNAVVRHLGRGLEVRYEHRVDALRRLDGRWTIATSDGATSGPYDAVIVAAPAPQAGALLAAPCPEIARRIDRVSFQPCWTAMLAFDQRLDVDFDGAHIRANGPLRWIARNASKPDRPAGETWIANANAAWATEHLEDAADDVLAALTEALFEHAGLSPVRPRAHVAHRWRYAFVDRPLGEPCLVDAHRGVVVCGDWCLAPRVEDALRSGVAAASCLKGDPPRSGPACPVADTV
jgi:predicted NAD/FAD-dependent oxidoreductase